MSCDQQGVTDLRRAGGQSSLWVRQGVRAIATTDATTEPPVIWVVLDMLAGFTSGGTGTPPAELDELLSGNATMQSKIDKLAETGISERHLFLLVRRSALSFPVYDALSFGGPLPAEAPALPGGLSQVWLLSGWQSGGVVRAIADDRWERVYPFD